MVVIAAHFSLPLPARGSGRAVLGVGHPVAAAQQGPGGVRGAQREGVVEQRAGAEDDLVAFVTVVGGRAGLLACGPLSVDATRPAGEVRPRLAWMLGLPMAGVRNSLDNGPGGAARGCGRAACRCASP